MTLMFAKYVQDMNSKKTLVEQQIKKENIQRVFKNVKDESSYILFVWIFQYFFWLNYMQKICVSIATQK